MTLVEQVIKELAERPVEYIVDSSKDALKDFGTGAFSLLGGYLAAKGYIDSHLETALSGTALSIVGVSLSACKEQSFICRDYLLLGTGILSGMGLPYSNLAPATGILALDAHTSKEKGEKSIVEHVF